MIQENDYFSKLIYKIILKSGYKKLHCSIMTNTISFSLYRENPTFVRNFHFISKKDSVIAVCNDEIMEFWFEINLQQEIIKFITDKIENDFYKEKMGVKNVS